ncbi:hypothetical protein [Streptomyces sp. Ru73]|uniref:hypothetical protein n=1 Tax=Streptomyces sp. Ru73 TaxID=2080748 RepID=UPI0015E455F0|nr:hypothetical protein [Streptomyces sp. Ru73]
MAATVPPHCSKCCPVVPRKPQPPPHVPVAAWVEFALLMLALAAGCALILWIGDSLFP